MARWRARRNSRSYGNSGERLAARSEEPTVRSRRRGAESDGPTGKPPTSRPPKPRRCTIPANRRQPPETSTMTSAFESAMEPHRSSRLPASCA